MPKKNPTWFCPTSDVGFHKIFCTEGNDKLLQIFVELDKFDPEKGEDGAANRFLRAIRDIGNTQVRQEEYNDTSLNSLFDASRYAHLNKDERMKYDNEMKFPPDYEEHAQYLAKKAAEKAAAEGKREVARKMKADGLEPSLIAKYSGLTVEEVEAL